jgi:hypothetical protein
MKLDLVDGWMDGWMDGVKLDLRDCLVQSNKDNSHVVIYMLNLNK